MGRDHPQNYPAWFLASSQLAGSIPAVSRTFSDSVTVRVDIDSGIAYSDSRWANGWPGGSG
jgi:hypothetical protein